MEPALSTWRWGKYSTNNMVALFYLSVTFIDHSGHNIYFYQVCLISQSLWGTTDLADISAPQRIVGYAQKQFGRGDGLVNNVACFPRNNLKSITTDVPDMLMAVNLRVPFISYKRAFDEIGPKTPSFTVVNIGAINANCGQPDLLGYSLSKGALQTMTRNLAGAHAG